MLSKDEMISLADLRKEMVDAIVEAGLKSEISLYPKKFHKKFKQISLFC